jgi:cytosine deaminase
MDTILRNARLIGDEARVCDVGIAAGRIAATGGGLPAGAPEIDLGGRLLAPGFVDTHIHLDKSCILERCRSEQGTLEEAIAQVSTAKRAFDAADVHARAARTLEKAILQGTTHMRTHVEVDPGIGLRGLDGVLPLVDEYRWAIDLEICVFPQEGLLNNPGTEALLTQALRRGCKVLGACPYTDSDPRGQIDRVFAIAREFGVDIDMHLDFDDRPEDMQIEYVCEQTQRHGWGGRVAVGHVSKLSVIAPERLAPICTRLADAGVAVTVLPATDLFLMGRRQSHAALRGVTPAHRMLAQGVNCTLSTNNVLNPFTPFGDCSLVRMANLYANVCQVGRRDDMRACFDMIGARAARLMRLANYGVAPGNAADLVVLDCETPEQAIAELSPALYGFKNGRMTFARARAQLNRP